MQKLLLILSLLTFHSCAPVKTHSKETTPSINTYLYSKSHQVLGEIALFPYSNKGANRAKESTAPFFGLLWQETPSIPDLTTAIIDDKISFKTWFEQQFLLSVEDDSGKKVTTLAMIDLDLKFMCFLGTLLKETEINAEGVLIQKGENSLIKDREITSSIINSAESLCDYNARVYRGYSVNINLKSAVTSDLNNETPYTSHLEFTLSRGARESTYFQAFLSLGRDLDKSYFQVARLGSNQADFSVLTGHLDNSTEGSLRLEHLSRPMITGAPQSATHSARIYFENKSHKLLFMALHEAMNASQNVHDWSQFAVAGFTQSSLLRHNSIATQNTYFADRSDYLACVDPNTQAPLADSGDGTSCIDLDQVSLSLTPLSNSTALQKVKSLDTIVSNCLAQNDSKNALAFDHHNFFTENFICLKGEDSSED